MDAQELPGREAIDMSPALADVEQDAEGLVWPQHSPPPPPPPTTPPLPVPVLRTVDPNALEGI